MLSCATAQSAPVLHQYEYQDRILTPCAFWWYAADTAWSSRHCNHTIASMSRPSPIDVCAAAEQRCITSGIAKSWTVHLTDDLPPTGYVAEISNTLWHLVSSFNRRVSNH